MRKNLFIVVLLSIVLVLSGGFAFADNGGGGDHITVKDNNVLVGKGNTGIQGNKNHHNVVIGGDINLGTNAGGKIINKNKNTNTNENTNVNFNLNKNENKNVNKNSQRQGQHQGQKQSLENNITIEGDEYEAAKMHIEGPALLKSDAKFSHGKKFTARTKGSVWEKVDFLTLKQAKRLGKGSTDAEVEEAIILEKEFRTKTLNKGIPADGEFMGTLTIYPDGTDVTAGGMEGRAAVAAMTLGATHMHRVHFGGGDRADGDAWNIGIGGGASIAQNGDQMMIAPNGGLGFGSADATNEQLPEMVFEIYCDEGTLELDDKKSAKQTGNHTQWSSQHMASNR